MPERRRFLARADERVLAVELRRGLREVGPRVGASGLLSDHSALRDKAGERVRIVQQLGEAVGVALEAGQAPDRRTGLAGRRRSDRFGWEPGLGDAPVGEGAVEPGQRRAATEDEALRE